MSRNLFPFLRKSLVKSESHVYPLLVLVGGGLGMGAYYGIQHARRSPDVAVSRSQRPSYAAAEVDGLVPDVDPTFGALHKLKDKPVSMFSKEKLVAYPDAEADSKDKHE